MVETTPGSQRSALEAAKLGEDIHDKVFVITGCYSGIGAETVKALLARGGKLIIGGRNKELLEKFFAQMKNEYGDSHVESCWIDLGDLDSVKSFANFVLEKEHKDIRVICNAGVMNTPEGLIKSGFEIQMGVNVIGHFLLCKLLADVTSRQVWVSSLFHKMSQGARINIHLINKYQANNFDGYDGWDAYQQSKLGNILLAKEFGNRYSKTMKAVSLHPGFSITKINRYSDIRANISFVFCKLPSLTTCVSGHLGMKSAEVGAATTVTCATLPKDKLINGGYYEDCDITTESEAAKNDFDAKSLFEFCDEATKEYQK